MPQTEAAPPLREDTHGVIPYVGVADLSLFQIDSEIEEMLELADDPELDEESRAAVDKQIAHYLDQKLKRDAVARVLAVQRIGHSIRALELNEAAEKAEADRHAARARAFENRKQRLKDYVLRTMQVHQVKRIDAPGTTLRVQGNGGLAPLEIYDSAQLPDRCLMKTVKLSLDAWQKIWTALEPGAREPLFNALQKSVAEPSNTVIREVLAGGPVKIGARLLDRAQRLVVE